MKNVTIIFNDAHRTKTVYGNVVKLVVHTYGFLELGFSNGSNEQFNMTSLFSFHSDFTVDQK